MTAIVAYDAAFVAVALTVLADRRGGLAVTALVPVVAAIASIVGARMGAPAHLVPIAVALAVAAPAARSPGPALALGVPTYGAVRAGLIIGLVYLVAVPLADGMIRRVEDGGRRRAPMRLLIVAFLYLALQPAGYA